MRHHRLFSLLAATFALTACDRDPPIVTTGLDAATAQQLFERMDRLIAALHTGSVVSSAPAGSSLAAAPAGPPERVAAPPELAALIARVEAIEQAVAHRQGVPTIPHAAFAGSFTPVPPRATAVVETLAAQLHDDGNEDTRRADARREARRSFFRMPEHQLLQRLGMPDEVELAEAGRASWRFTSGRHHVSVTLDGGFVAEIYGSVDDG